jgi:hypothetical protein
MGWEIGIEDPDPGEREYSFSICYPQWHKVGSALIDEVEYRRTEHGMNVEIGIKMIIKRMLTE